MASLISQIGTAAPKMTPALEDGKDIFVPQSNCQEAQKEFNLSVEFLTYVVKEHRGSWWKGSCFRSARFKKVLDNINLVLKSGQLTAVLGGSGSGKTSLLDTLSYRQEGSVFGRICYCNEPTTRDMMHKLSSYVIQADRLLPNLTVRETLTYSARLRLGGSHRFSEIKTKVHEVILSMGLKSVADSRIGGGIQRGISGGERRRVTIAIQLLTDPKILLLDEPTTGLDSYTAKYLIRSLAYLAHRGKIVLITIHQPSSDLLNVFDQMVLLSEGRQVFSGPRDKMLSHFSELKHPCPMYANPMDIYVDLVTVDKRNKAVEFESRNRVDGLVDSFKQSPLNVDTIDSFSNNRSTSSGRKVFSETRQRPGTLRNIATLVSRMLLNIFRDKRIFIMRNLQLPLFIVFILVFLGRLKDNQAGIQDRTGLLYQVVSAPAFASVIHAVEIGHYLWDIVSLLIRWEAITACEWLALIEICCVPSPASHFRLNMQMNRFANSFYFVKIDFMGLIHLTLPLTSIILIVVPSLRDLFYRETRDGLYGAALFVVSYFLFIIPFNITATGLFSAGIYWISGMHPGLDRFLIATGVVFVIFCICEMIMIAYLGAFRDQLIAAALCNCFLVTSVLFSSGFMRNVHSMLDEIQTLNYVFFHKYASEIIAANEFHGLNFTCSPVEQCVFPDGDAYLRAFYPDAMDNMTRNAYILGGFLVASILIPIVSFKVRGTPNLR